MNETLRRSLPWAAILLVCLLGYGNILQHDFNLDDAYILKYLPGPGESVWSVFTQPFGLADYRPLSLLSFAFEQRMAGGIDPHTAHGVNLFLYILLCLLIYATLRLLPMEQAPLIALCTVLLFAAHPVHSGVVSSIKSRDTILSLLLAVGAIWFVTQAETHRRQFLYLPAFLCFLAGLYTKLDSMVLIFLIPMLQFFFFRASWKKISLFYFILLAGIILLRYLPVNQLILDDAHLRHSVSPVENPITADPGLGNSLSQALQTLFVYLKFMLLPTGYHFYFGYDMLPLQPLFSPATLFYLVLHLLLIGFGVSQYKRRPVLSFAVLGFYASLSYCSNLITPVAGIIADRYAFYASLSYCLLLAAGLYALTGRIQPLIKQPLPANKANRSANTPAVAGNRNMITLAGTAMLALIYMGCTIDRNRDWQHIFTLLEADMPALERSFEANRIAASNYLKAATETEDKGLKKIYTEKGLQYALAANAVYPGNAFILESIGQAYFNLGFPAKAIPVLQETLVRFDSIPTSPEVLGDIYYIRGDRYDSAAYYYRIALERKTQREQVPMKYLRALFRNGQKTEAARFSDSLLQRRPDNYLAWHCKAFVLLQQGDSLNGLRVYARSFDMGYRNPDDARDVQHKLYRMKDTASARKLDAYLQP